MEQIRTGVDRLRHPDLPQAERIPGLYQHPYLVADGRRRLGDALIDRQRRVPYTMATMEAVDAVLRNPQGGLRCFQRVFVRACGRPVVTADGSELLPAEDQKIVTSAFVHIAVEGGLLYASFTATALHPTRDDFQLVDKLHAATGDLAERAIRDCWRAWPRATLGAPARALVTMFRMATHRHRSNRARLASGEYRSYDYGARISVREIASQVEVNYLQLMDAEKYTRLIELAIFDELETQLHGAGVDTSEVRARAAHIQNTNSITFSGNPQFHGATAIGANASASDNRGSRPQHPSPSSAR
jgi:hypothetical protein